MGYDEAKIPEYEKIWDEMAKETFNNFMNETMGWAGDGDPPCYGSGDQHSYCRFCIVQPGC